MIQIPEGLLAADEPYVPDIGRLYWLEKPLLDPQDPEAARPGAVLAISDDGNVITVAQRSSSEQKGEFHPKDRDHGLNKDGWFSRLRSVQSVLWTPSNAHSVDLVLDEPTLAYVRRYFGL